MGWVAAGDGYEVCLADGRVVCRSPAGKQLKTVPKALQEAPAVVELRQVKEWLGRHDTACLREVEDWLVRSLPVPTMVLASVWPDLSWRAALRDAVVAPVEAGVANVAAAGFLRDVDPRGRLGVVDLDGESGRLTAERVLLPHPVLLSELDELREFAVDLGVKQGVLQLFREVWRRPERPEEFAAEAGRYAGGKFAQLRHLTGRATSLGYATRGGYVTRRLWERGRPVDACVWVGADDPSVEAVTGELTFVDTGGAPVPLPDIGAVAWSEGMRMASALYAGRVVESGDEA
jgi:hypothetical protein